MLNCLFPSVLNSYRKQPWTSLVLNSASWWNSGVYIFLQCFLTFFSSKQRQWVFIKGVKNIREHFWKWSRSSLYSQTEGAFPYYSYIISVGKRILFPFAQVIFLLSKAGLQTHCKPPSIGKDMPVGASLTHKHFRNIPHFWWVAATRISSSFKKQNENTMVTQTWKHISHYHGYVLEALTSAELRKLATKVQLEQAVTAGRAQC